MGQGEDTDRASGPSTAGTGTGLGSGSGGDTPRWELSPAQVAAPLATRLRAELAIRRRHEDTAGRSEPIVVGLDGRSGSGKSTVAAAVAEAFERVTVVEGDSFYTGGSAATWDRRTAAENARLVIDWRRQRAVLEDLRQHGTATWHPFDWDADGWDREPVPLASRPVTVVAAPVVVLDGTYSCRPELADLLDLRVLLEVPRDLRRRRLLDREGDDHDAAWDQRWAATEDHYFERVMTPDRFDLVLTPA